MTVQQTTDLRTAPGGGTAGAAQPRPASAGTAGTGQPRPAAAVAASTTDSSRRAYAKRQRRLQKATAAKLITPGKPVDSALNRAPFVIILIAVLGAGLAAVLGLNTLTGEAGMRTSKARSASSDLRLTIEAMRRDVALLDSTERIAGAAAQLGLVPAGDAAMLQIDGSGMGTVVGTPTAVPAPPPPSAPATSEPAAAGGQPPVSPDQPAVAGDRPVAPAGHLVPPAGPAAAPAAQAETPAEPASPGAAQASAAQAPAGQAPTAPVAEGGTPTAPVTAPAQAPAAVPAGAQQ